MTTASIEFRTRENMDGRHFKTWYHYDDLLRLQWAIFNKLSDDKKKQFQAPHVFFDGIDSIAFKTVLEISLSYFKSINKKYFPFIFKPELASAHYIAGVFRRGVDDKISLVFFNPVGGSGHLDFDGFNKDISVLISPHKIQTSEKDGGGLFSCGPLSLYFVEYVLNHPEWLDTLDENFNLPDSFVHLLDSNTYIKTVKELRNKHDQMLDGIEDQQLDTIEDSYAAFNIYFLEQRSKRNLVLDTDEEYYSDDGMMLELDENDNDIFEEVEEDLGHDQMDMDGNPVVDCVKTIVDEEKPAPCPNNCITQDIQNRFDVLVIKKEIERLKSIASSSCFDFGSADKASKIQKALDDAIKRGVQDVRVDSMLRTELAAHRIFSFFGQKTAQSLVNVDKTFVVEESNKSPSSP